MASGDDMGVSCCVKKNTKAMREYIFLIIILFFLSFGAIHAQESDGFISGKVTVEQTDDPLGNVNLQLTNTSGGTVSGSEGAFILGPLSPGVYNIKARHLGYQTVQDSVQVNPRDTVTVRIAMTRKAVNLRPIAVNTLKPGLAMGSQISQEAVQQAPVSDAGDLMRDQQGTSAVRRGPLGLDPVIRGLRGSQVGTYVDGMRIFSGGPARMDAPLSHIDPAAIQSIDIVKGPYALTWGAGNLSAIQVQTRDLWEAQGLVNGHVSSGYRQNASAFDQSLTLHGSSGRWAYRLMGSWRQGNAYQAGDGTRVPANFQAQAFRGKLGYQTGAQSELILSAGYQSLLDVSYPGRLLNAKFFHTQDFKARWHWESDAGGLEEVELMAYHNQIDHKMNNDGKPTAEADTTRMPPFPLAIRVNADVKTSGGRAAVKLNPGKGWRVTLGADGYHTHKTAFREVGPANKDKVAFADFMWPKASITNTGAFLRVEHDFNRHWSFSATGRLDWYQTSADTLSDFYRGEVSNEDETDSRNLSGAFNLNYTPTRHWHFYLAGGSAVRTPDVKERYSDRIPASKAQTSAEFVGRPGLAGERNNQLDAGVEAQFGNWGFSVSGFYREVENYITLLPTDLPKRLPLSPSTVFQYTNGRANFTGGEGRMRYQLGAWQLEGGFQYLWAKEATLEEPVLGIPPLQGHASLRWSPLQKPFFLESRWRWVDDQDRIAAIKGETATDGYVVGNIRAGYQFSEEAMLYGGVRNLSDNFYINHLNTKNPFTGRQIPEPGRSYYLKFQYAF